MLVLAINVILPFYTNRNQSRDITSREVRYLKYKQQQFSQLKDVFLKNQTKLNIKIEIIYRNKCILRSRYLCSIVALECCFKLLLWVKDLPHTSQESAYVCG